MKVQTVLKLLAAGVAMAVAAGAQAQSAGQWSVTAGMNKITPKVKSGDISAPALPGTKADVGSDTEPVLIFDYAYTDNISVEAALGLPYKHKLYGAGAIQGVGQVGEVQVLPPTLFAQYHFFEPKAMVRPYVGVGLTYAWFRKTTGSGQMTALTNVGSGTPTTFKIDNKLTGTIQLGTTVAFSDKWFANIAVTKTFLKTKVNFSTGQTQDMTLDPQAVMIGIGRTF